MVFDFSSRVPTAYRKYLAYFKPRTLSIDGQPIDILVYEQKGSSQQSVLITAGFDGDEWDGIMAALTLPERITKLYPHLSITVVPIGNPLGFFEMMSPVPSDLSFPKYYFGESSPRNKAQKLVASIFDSLKQPFDVWIDLHGGSQHEQLKPFTFLYETRNDDLNALSRHLASVLSKDETFFLCDYPWSKIDALASRYAIYVLSEAGEGMDVRQSSIQCHISRVVTILDTLTTSRPKPSAMPRSRVQSASFPFGVWEPVTHPGQHVRKGEVIGFTKIFFGMFSFPVKAIHSGKVLWIRKSNTPKTSEVLFELLLD